MQNRKLIRIVMPQWQGGNNPAYLLGAELLAWLAPEADHPVINIPVSPVTETVTNENGIVGRTPLLKQLQSVWDALDEHQPDKLTVLGGDCLVDLAPFAYLSERYGDKLGVLWIDTHPDVSAPAQFAHAHAHVLGALMGHGDPDLTARVTHPVKPAKVMIAGIHSPLGYEQDFLATHNIRTCSPEALRDGSDSVQEWIRSEGIEYLAIHLDLDVLDHHYFRALLFARPGVDPHQFDGVAQGRMSPDEVVNLISRAAQQADVVGMGIAEHLPWDAINLKTVLEKLPLLGGQRGA